MKTTIVIGTAGIGMWVTAHECGHGAFSDNRILQTCVGYIFHSLLLGQLAPFIQIRYQRLYIHTYIHSLVPYFSWQRTHAIHHANTNHITDGETHVPPVFEGPHTEKQQLIKMIGVYHNNVYMYVCMHILKAFPSGRIVKHNE